MDIMNRISFITSIIASIIASIFFITSCATLTQDIKVEIHADSGADFSTFKSYAWASSEQIVFDPIGQWEQPTLNTDKEVKFNINQELRAKGLFETQDNPDLLVTFSAGVDMTHMELKQNPDSPKNVLTNAPKAALVIALIDTRTGYTVWLGFAEGDVQPQQTIENIRARIDYAVSKILKAYK
ncbi:hypothetical protein MNBD_GAMMA06-1101 [hydrothermal vent metagenome]|uniref:DUF4136 domain-containing protein n=1 Tax=hydrothermal vent metagenome TaxID=652676 RepID=A0A3B0WKE1_9ZZZZ